MQYLISHLQIICDNVYRENVFAVYDHKFQKSLAIHDFFFSFFFEFILLLGLQSRHCRSSVRSHYNFTYT